MTPKTFRFGIFPKMLIAMAAIAIIPLVLTWQYNISTTTERMTAHVNNQLDELSDGLVAYVDTWVEMNLRMLRQNAATSRMQSMNPEQQEELLKLIVKEYDWNYLAFTVGLDGNNIARSDGKALKYYGDRTYVSDVLRGKERGQQVLIGKTSGKPAFILAVPIHSGPNGRLVGVLAIAMTIAELSERITQAHIGETGYAFLLDEQGKVIAHQSPEFTRTQKDLSRHPAYMANYNRTSNIIYTDEDGRKLVSVNKSTRYGWTLVAEQAYDEAFAEVAAAKRNALIFMVATLVAVVAIAFLFSRGLSVPIQRLTVVAEKISHGQFDSEITYSSRRDEIGALANSIELLATSTRILMERMRTN